MSMTFAEELRHVVATEPVLDADDPEPSPTVEPRVLEEWVARRQPRGKAPVDASGDLVRVYERDDEEGVQAILRLNLEKDVYESDVWRDIVQIRHTHPGQVALREAWLGMDDEQKFRYHIRQKCPNASWSVIWAGYRNGHLAHARLLDRASIEEVWIQWIVGTQALGRSGHTLAIALWDIGVRRMCWKFLPAHGLLNGHWRKFPGMIIEPPELWEAHHPGQYLKGRFEMPQRPDKPYTHYRRSGPPQGAPQ